MNKHAKLHCKSGCLHTHHMWWISKKTKLKTEPNITFILVKPPGTGTNRQKDAQQSHMGASAGPRPSLTPNRSGGFPGVASVMELGDEKTRFMGEAKEQRLTLNDIHISRCACVCVCVHGSTQACTLQIVLSSACIHPQSRNMLHNTGKK